MDTLRALVCLHEIMIDEAREVICTTKDHYLTAFAKRQEEGSLVMAYEGCAVGLLYVLCVMMSSYDYPLYSTL